MTCPKSYMQATTELRKVGTAHATGDSLRAMYAQLAAQRMRGAKPERFYDALAGKTDDELLQAYTRLSMDAGHYTVVLLGADA